MRSLYHYRPLEHTNSFRLLTLHSASEPSDPIRCSLQHALLSEPLDYEAVSYTWGEVTTLYPILVEHDWSELFVRINCYNMLHHLRHADHDRLLWIDAICINQTDLDERGHQVKSMDKIYKHASRVVVHLGEETPGSRILFEELVEGDMELSETGQCIQRDPRQSSKEELEKLLQRPWFYRVWVLQEVKNNPCILYMCGSAQTSAKILNLWLEQCRVRVLESVEDDWPLGVALGRVPQDKTYCNAQFGLWSWLLRSRSCLASDPRDKIFALKSLLSEEHVRKAMDVLIDYTKTTEETFIATALFLIPVIGLRIFGATRRPHDLAMPSWIPDFSQTLPIGWSFYPHKLGSDNPETDFLVETRSRNAGFFKADFNAQKHGEPPKIHVVALPYATICHSSDTFSFQTLEDAHDQLIMLYHLPSRPGALTNADTSARKTSIAGNLCPQILDAIKLLHPDELYMNLCRGSYYDAATQFDYKRFHHCMHECKIVLTDTEELFIVPGQAKKKDLICIPKGGVSPCILRPLDDRYWKLISGDCHHFGGHSLQSDVVEELFFYDEYCEKNKERLKIFTIC